MRRTWPWLLPLLIASGVALTWDKPPGVAERNEAIGDVSGLTRELAVTFRDGESFEPKKPPGRSDWLASHKEPGQTFSEYTGSRPNLPFAERKTLYIMPIGGFDPELAPSLEELQDYTARYFHPLEVKLTPKAEGWEKRIRSRINPATQRKQLNSLDTLKWMKAQLPGDAYAMIAVTMTDLYPNEEWNFVFGQASLRNRVGVFSFARYHPSWMGGEVHQGTRQLVLRRATKVLTHEMGHMFGIKHCVHFECNMNGANHLTEADNTPMYLCPVCLRKLHHANKFDPVERYERLRSFYQKHGLEEEQDWVSERLTTIKAATQK